MGYDAFLKLVVDNNEPASDEFPSRDAKSANTSRQRGGMPRCRHLWIAASDAPSAFASRRTSSHEDSCNVVMKRIMDNLSRKSTPEIPVTAQSVLGQWVQEQARALAMDENPIKKRMREARQAVGLTQGQVAQYLNVSDSTYAKWENRSRSKIPHEYIGPFCVLVHVDPSWLITGNRWPDALHQPPKPTDDKPPKRRRTG